jgi:hypothetical protein
MDDVLAYHARRNAEARAALLAEFGAVPATDVPVEWIQEDRVVTVFHEGVTVVPAFQLTSDGQPHPAIRGVITTLREAGAGNWEIALWWINPTGYLRGRRRPVDVLTAGAALEPADLERELTEAASREVNFEAF